MREGYWIVHGRHQLPYWDQKDNKQYSVQKLENGKTVELPKYTTKPFKMLNTEGRQPMSEQESLYIDKSHRDNPETQDVIRTPSAKGMKAMQHGGLALLSRTGYMVDYYRLNPKQRQRSAVFKEKILKIVEDQNLMRHLALVVGPGKPRWIPATSTMNKGDVNVNDASGEQKTAEELELNGSYMLKSLPIGTEICMVEEFPGSGARFANSNARYGIVTGRLGRGDKDSLITVSFPYASLEGITNSGFAGKVNYKGVLSDQGLHNRMGGIDAQIIMEDGSIELPAWEKKDSRQKRATGRHGPWEGYFDCMSTHRENSYDQTPQSLYDQDVALSGNCVAVIGRASEGGEFNSWLLHEDGRQYKLYGGNKSNGFYNREIRKSGLNHISMHFRKFKRAPGQLVNNQGNQFVLLKSNE